MSATTQENRLLKITTPLGEDFLLLNRLSATEEISSLFSFEVELLHDEGDERGFVPTVVEAKSILGQEVSIDIYQRDGTTRTLSGIVNHFSQGHRDKRFTYFHATIVPNIWILTQISQSRIFQHKSVPDILKEVFKGFNVSYEIQGTFHPRNYCVQYRETDFDFASRLMEEEGIYYFFEHTGGKNKLIVANTPQSHPNCPSKHEISFALKVTEEEDYITSIKKWQNDHRLQSGKVTFWDFNFQVPSNKLDAEQPSLYKVADNDQMEIYDFPGGYAPKFDDIDRGGGTRSDVSKVFEDKQKKAEIAMQALDSQYRVITGRGDCSAMTAGHRFKFFNHPNDAQNAQYVITSVSHDAEQNPTYETNNEIEQPYGNSFTCIAHGAGAPPFRPMRKTSKPIVQGSQTAFVVGPAGEEI
ncbi:MAG TPA: type VI secretion system tip protein TssI/VgrG, partial [Pyrinomonadaceae bacterium]|nr:type VI secretion system tip protein TssI/VgrG [Pyrinomonadaceae bacterium]